LGWFLKIFWRLLIDCFTNRKSKTWPKKRWIDEIFWKTSPLYKAYILDILVYRQHFHKYVPANGFWFSFIKSCGQPIWNQTQFALTKSSLIFQYFEIWRRNRVFQHIILLLWQKLSNFLIAQKTNMRTNMERPKSMELFGLCGLFTTMSILIGLICASMCVQVHCLYLIGWWKNIWIEEIDRAGSKIIRENNTFQKK